MRGYLVSKALNPAVKGGTTEAARDTARPTPQEL
jgi:hypothetical protein